MALSPCLNYNCDELGEHEVNTLNCIGPRPGGVSEIILVLCASELTDPSDGVEVAALLASGDARLIQSIRFGLNAAEPTQSPKTTSCGLPQTLFVTYSGTLTDYSWNQANMDLYTTLAGGYTVAGIIARQCPKDGFADQSLWLSGEVAFGGSPIVPDDDEEAARFELTFQYKGTVEIISTPTGVFSS